MRAALPVLLVAVLTLATALLPLAAADHVWSHRIYVVGRVVDADGLPAPGIPVNATFSNLTIVGSCYDSKGEVTGPRGDYEICRHAHALTADARVTIRAAGETRELPIDPDLRHADASFQLLTPRTLRDFEGDIEFARTVHVAGRTFALLPEPANAEGIHVNASPIGGNVTIELIAEGEVIASKNVTVGEQGIYSAQLDVDPLPAGALASVRLGADATEVVIDPTFRRADLNIVRDLRLMSGPGDDAPGSAPTPGAAWGALGALLMACGARRRRRR